MQIQTSGDFICVPYSAGQLILERPKFSVDIGTDWAVSPMIQKRKKVADYPIISQSTDTISFTCMPTYANSTTSSGSGKKYTAIVQKQPDEVQPVDISAAITNCPATINMIFKNFYINTSLDGSTFTQLDGSGSIEGYFNKDHFCAKLASETWSVDANAWILSDDPKAYFKLQYKTHIYTADNTKLHISRAPDQNNEICCVDIDGTSSKLRRYGIINDTNSGAHYVIGDYPVDPHKRFAYLTIDDNTLDQSIARLLNELDSVYVRT